MVLFWVTLVLAMLVQPLAPVTVTEYNPALLTVAERPETPPNCTAPLLNANKVPNVVPAVRVTLVAVQLSGPLAVRVAPGAVELLVMLLEAVAVQPLTSVRVTENVPVVLAMIVGEVAVVDQRKVPVPMAVNVWVGCVQVSTALLGLIETIGGVQPVVKLKMVFVRIPRKIRPSASKKVPSSARRA
jgi:hypothetical protein